MTRSEEMGVNGEERENIRGKESAVFLFVFGSSLWHGP